MRIEAISFFLMIFLLSAWLIQLLWNYLGRDFKALPRLSYPKALGVTVLWVIDGMPLNERLWNLYPRWAVLRFTPNNSCLAPATARWAPGSSNPGNFRRTSSKPYGITTIRPKRIQPALPHFISRSSGRRRMKTFPPRGI